MALEWIANFQNQRLLLLKSLSAWTPASAKWPGAAFAGFRFSEKFRDVSGQCRRQLVQIADRRVFQTSFDPADVSTIDPGVDGKLFLGDPVRHPNSSQVPSYERNAVHARTAPFNGALNHGV